MKYVAIAMWTCFMKLTLLLYLRFFFEHTLSRPFLYYIYMFELKLMLIRNSIAQTHCLQ